jgi:hypothetical protein
MQKSRSILYALSVCAATAILAGCSSEGSPAAPAGPMQRISIRSDMTSRAISAKPFTSLLSGEVLDGNQVHVVQVSCHRSRARTTFTASGSTTGSYPGTFTATGKWRFGVDQFGRNFWAFHQSFTITSGKSNIPGTIAGYGGGLFAHSCARFDLSPLTYNAGEWWSGTATTTGISEGVLGETLK